jgi:beta-lactamase regulating signal transducer with metallopeptidase domain
VLVQMAVTGTLVFVAALGVTAAMRRSAAAARHIVWACALFAALGIPAMVFFGPTWSLPVLPATTTPFEAGTRVRSAIPAPVGAARGAGPQTAVTVRDSSSTKVFQPTAMQIVTLVWLVGAAIGLARLVAGLLVARRLVRRAVPVEDWTWRVSAQRIADLQRIETPVTLRATPDASVPMTWGLWRRSVLLLPHDAANWPADRRRAVLLHEMAHVKRRDCLVRSLAQAACTLHWFNPFAHLALRRLRAEQERACDDVVLAAGMAGCDYANHLLDIVRASCATALDRAALAMGRRSELEGRMFDILDDSRRRDSSSRRTKWMAMLATVTVIGVLGTMRLTGAQTQAAAFAPHVTGLPVDQRAGRVDFSRVQWTRTVDEQTRRRVADVLGAALADRDEQVRDRARQGLDAIAALADGTVTVSSPCAGNCIFDEAFPFAPAALFFEFETRWALFEIQSQDVVTRKRGIGRLMGRTESSAAALAQFLQDSDPQIRGLAAIRLDSVVYPGAVPGWVNLLADNDASLRERAAISLGAIGDPSSIEPLTTALFSDSSLDVRRQAARSLGRIAAGG